MIKKNLKNQLFLIFNSNNLKQKFCSFQKLEKETNINLNQKLTSGKVKYFKITLKEETTDFGYKNVFMHEK